MVNPGLNVSIPPRTHTTLLLYINLTQIQTRKPFLIHLYQQDQQNVLLGLPLTPLILLFHTQERLYEE